MGMRARPGEGLSFRFKKTIDDRRPPFGCVAPTAARCFATDDIPSRIHGQADGVGENHFAPVRNLFRVDGAMSGAKSLARGAFVLSRASIGATFSARPINRHARE